MVLVVVVVVCVCVFMYVYKKRSSVVFHIGEIRNLLFGVLFKTVKFQVEYIPEK